MSVNLGTSYVLTYKHFPWRIDGYDARDAEGIQSLVDFLGDKVFDTFVVAAQREHDRVTVEDLFFLLSFAGVDGFPAHAFMRTFRCSEYVEYINAPRPSEPMVDSRGFPIADAVEA